jgi:hypothetical protein
MQPIATREFTDPEGRPVKLTIGKPVVDQDLRAWSCPVTFSSASREHATAAVGEDSLQALILALDLAKTLTSFLSKAEGPFRWFDLADLGFHFELKIPDEWRSEWPFNQGSL